MKNNKKLLILSTLAFLLIASFGLLKVTLAQTNQTNAEAIDAIGVRVLPNPNHYSIARWYQSQGFYGSPQSLTVDGYEAIRDGRTVYVSAANTVGKDVYTNIYLISYNQDPSEKTVDILGQIVSRWKFNSNLENYDFENQATCSISSMPCSNNSDCGQGRICAQEGLAKDSCQLQEDKNCRSDSDCPSNFFCDSDKAKITRDMKRIGRIDEMRDALANYYQAQGRYPLLDAGTYLTNKSVSLWPSWQKVFLNNIAISPNFIDPINRLGSCPDFDLKTCWNANENRFYSNPNDNTLVLPPGSYAMVYATSADGGNYNLCATLESRHPSLNYNFVGSNLNESLCVSDIGVDTSSGSDNNPPVLVDGDYNLSGQAGKEFNGYIKVYDADNDPLKWEITLGEGMWSVWSPDVFRIMDTSNKFQKKIFASKAPSTNSTFPITLRVTDSRGGVLTENLEVQIQDYGVFIEAQNVVHVLDKNAPLIYSFHVSGDNLSNPPNLSLNKVSGNGTIPFTLSETILVSENRYRATFKANLIPLEEYQFPENTDFGFEVVAIDRSGKEFKKSFSLRLISEKPVLQFSCANKTRAGQNYSCFLGKTDYFGRGFSYEISGAPQTLEIDIDEDKAEAYISGQAQASAAGSSQLREHPITVVARSDYGATTTRSFNLTVNSFCGDGILQSPNSENRGGINNDGYEQCDGKSGTASDASTSSSTQQYACSTFNSETPLEIASGNYCVFKSSLSGGGYCGDGYCQTRYETKDNCNDCSDGSNVVATGSCSFNSDCETWQECNLVLGRCVVASGQCDTQNDCALGFDCINNKCEAKIFPNLETIKVITFREGDATRAGIDYHIRKDDRSPYNFTSQEITEAVGANVKECKNGSNLSGCTIVKMDDPYCVDNSDQYYNNKNLPVIPNPNPLSLIQCPLGYTNLLMYARLSRSGSDRCYDNNIPNACRDNWCGRYLYRCEKQVMEYRKVGTDCRPTLGSTDFGGVMNYEGRCVIKTTAPSYCGDGTCDSGEACSSCSQDCGACLIDPKDPTNYDVTEE